MSLSKLIVAVASLFAVFQSAPTQAQTAEDINRIIRQLAPIADQVVSPEPSAGTLTATAPVVSQQIHPQGVIIEVILEERVLVIDSTYSMDFEVYFAFDSADLTAQGRADLNALGHALASSELSPYSYLVAGHTDAAGNAGYNQQLSDRRAATARSYLLENFTIDPSRLLTVGFGETRLRDAANPRSGINRRVEVAMIVARTP